MSPDDLFHWAGEQIGRFIRGLVGGLTWLFGHLSEAADSFYRGLADALGMSHSTIGLLLLLVGVVLLVSGLRRVLRGHLVSALLVGGLGVLLLGWLIH